MLWYIHINLTVIFISYKSHAFSYEYLRFLGPLKWQSEIQMLEMQGNESKQQCMQKTQPNENQITTQIRDIKLN